MLRILKKANEIRREDGLGKLCSAAVVKFIKTLVYSSVLSSIIRRLVKYDAFYNIYQGIFRLFSRSLYPRDDSQVHISDWDYLIILDGCRFDTFKQINDLDGNLFKISSGAGWTKEWVMKTFSSGDWSDTIYISASPWTTEKGFQDNLGGNPFYLVDNVWEYAWDDANGTCQPDKVKQAAMNWVSKEPDKNLIIHFQQPHQPFVGNNQNIDWKGNEATEPEHRDDMTRVEYHVWKALRNGDVEAKDATLAYRDNLKLVLSEVSALLKYLDGDVVITSDHGNCFGEFNLFGHPGALVPQTVEVPWFQTHVEQQENPKTKSIGRGSHDTVNEQTREERLEQLGYLQ